MKNGHSYLSTLFRIYIAITLLGILFSTSYPVHAVTPVFVAVDGDGSACSQGNPCSLANGLSQVDAGGTLYAAAGTYHGTGDQVVLLNKGINFLGGWNRGSTGVPVRDPDAYLSILDGENLRRIITINGGDSVAVDGWTIQNGNATGKVAICGAWQPAGCGGGILISGGTTTIENSIIHNNIAATTTGDPAHTGYGGGIYVQNPESVTISNNAIRSNDASTASSGPVGSNGIGGGIYVTGAVDTADLTVTGNEISDNDATAPYYTGWGGGIAIDNSHGVINDNYIHDNATNLSTFGSGIYASLSDLTLKGNRFIDNAGGEILYFVDLNGTLDSNIIINPLGGYGVFMTSNNPPRSSVLVNNIIAQHSTANIALVGSSDYTVTVNIYHNTLDDSAYGLYLMSYSYVAIANSIVSHHSTSGIQKSGANIYAAVNYTLFHGNTADGTWDYMPHSVPTGDPYYLDETGGDYRIQATSAARDVAPYGSYSVDFEGDVRPMGSGGTAYDVGADEFWWKINLPLIRKN